MKGQLSVETVLMVLLVVVAIGAFFAFLMRITTKVISGTQEVLIYPENAPQILSINCYATYGYVAIAEDLNGTINFRVRNLNGTTVNTSSLTVDISGYGVINFTAPMEDGSYYEVRFYTPKWSVSETCSP
jgi:hypothetical protein